MFIAIALHVLSAVVWVGGMFFAYMALRPVAASQLQPPQRLPLWVAVFGRFFPWVWLTVLLLLTTGYWMSFTLYGGIAQAPHYVLAMQYLGLLMVGLFMHVFFAPYRRMKQALAAGDLPEAGRRLGQIRMIIALNLTLGLTVVLVASAGRFF